MRKGKLKRFEEDKRQIKAGKRKDGAKRQGKNNIKRSTEKYQESTVIWNYLAWWKPISTTLQNIPRRWLYTTWDNNGCSGKESAWKAGGPGLILGSGRTPGEGNGNPLQYSCLENPMDGGSWWATVHGVAKSWTWLHFHGDVFELLKRGWVVFNVLCLGSQDNCDLLTHFLYKGNKKYIFKEVLGALRSTQLSPQWVSPQGFQKAPMFYSMTWEMGPNSATCTWPCWLVARSPPQPHMCDQGCPGFDRGTSSSRGYHPPLSFWHLSPEILLIL